MLTLYVVSFLVPWQCQRLCQQRSCYSCLQIVHRKQHAPCMYAMPPYMFIRRPATFVQTCVRPLTQHADDTHGTALTPWYHFAKSLRTGVQFPHAYGQRHTF